VTSSSPTHSFNKTTGETPAVAEAPIVEAETMRHQFDTLGFAHLRSIFSQESNQRFLNLIREESQLRDHDAPHVISGVIKGYLSPGMVCRERVFWPLITSQPILTAIGALLGADFKFCLAADVGFAHRSGYPFHRDTVIDTQNGPHWDHSLSTYGIVRAITCFHEHRTFRFGVTPRSHLPQTPYGDVNEPSVQWFDLNPGDVMLFDPRIRHSGQKNDFPKYGVILTYGKNNEYTQEYYFYRRLVQLCDLYEAPSSEFIQFLRDQNLFQEYIHNENLLGHYEKKFAHIPKRNPEQETRYRMR